MQIISYMHIESVGDGRIKNKLKKKTILYHVILQQVAIKKSSIWLESNIAAQSTANVL